MSRDHVFAEQDYLWVLVCEACVGWMLELVSSAKCSIKAACTLSTNSDFPLRSGRNQIWLHACKKGKTQTTVQKLGV